MSLLTDIAHEDDIPIIINIHEVDLAVDYADRIIGLSDGEIVFNGPPDDLDQAARDEIYRGGESIADREEPSAGNSTDADDVIAERGD
jgi:phosphonate transport system ATP-binding protein